MLKRKGKKERRDKKKGNQHVYLNLIIPSVLN